MISHVLGESSGLGHGSRNKNYVLFLVHGHFTRKGKKCLVSNECLGWEDLFNLVPEAMWT